MESSIYSPQQIEKLVLDNLGLVYSVAKSLRPANRTELEEYIQIGSIGLWKAIVKHNPQRAKLATIAWDYIRWEIIRYINKNNRYYRAINSPEAQFARQKVADARAANIGASQLYEILPNTLSKSERIVVDMRNQGYTFEEIGEELGGYTRGWANKLFKSAITKIRNANEETYIDG